MSISDKPIISFYINIFLLKKFKFFWQLVSISLISQSYLIIFRGHIHLSWLVNELLVLVVEEDTVAV